MSHILTLQEIVPVTHDTYQLTFNRPDGFVFEAGQATELTLLRDGWRDEARPFTMTSRPNDPHLEFVIKSYPDHDGVTEQVASLKMTDQVSVTDPFGAITDRGPGVFIAGGAGITPFISILRKQQEEGATGSHLIFANKTDQDIILQQMWQSMPGVEATFVVSDQDDTAHVKGKLDKATLDGMIADHDQPFYICGPGGMVNDVRDALKDSGVSADNIHTEDGW